MSLAISRISKFVTTTDAALQARFPGIIKVTFGHLGDGNLHYNIGTSQQFTDEQLIAHQDEIYEVVNDRVAALGGSISAEHGIGQLKVGQLLLYKTPQVVTTMALIKRALDPHCLLNPGKVLPAY